MVTRSGFALLEVVIALLVFTIGALGASALTIHAAALATRAGQAERAAWRATSLLSSLAETDATGQGMIRDRVATYRWSAGDAAAVVIEVVAVTHAGADTIRMVSARLTPPPLLRAEP